MPVRVADVGRVVDPQVQFWRRLNDLTAVGAEEFHRVEQLAVAAHLHAHAQARRVRFQAQIGAQRLVRQHHRVVHDAATVKAGSRLRTRSKCGASLAIFNLTRHLGGEVRRYLAGCAGTNYFNWQVERW
ncbi:MAG: hypothetical protein QOE41_643, partial [Mycobacterium sp.]|nr:hypothetical protein [Mycobacterium sp.]